jgi:hypothetical protein
VKFSPAETRLQIDLQTIAVSFKTDYGLGQLMLLIRKLLQSTESCFKAQKAAIAPSMRPSALADAFKMQSPSGSEPF